MNEGVSVKLIFVNCCIDEVVGRTIVGVANTVGVVEAAAVGMIEVVDTTISVEIFADSLVVDDGVE